MSKASLTQNWLLRGLVCCAVMMGFSVGQLASAATIELSVETSVLDETTGTRSIVPVQGFRYLVEEDTTYKPIPGTVDYDSLAFNFHKSHNPVVGLDDSGAVLSGVEMTATATINLPDAAAGKNYFVSVLPFEGHTLGAGAVTVSTGVVEKTVRVNRFPVPTAQISIQVFHDNNPVNGARDLDEEILTSSLVTREVNGKTIQQEVPFSVLLFDAAGQYGAAGGRLFEDAYGNPIGTEYDANGNITSMPEDNGVNGFVITADRINERGRIVIKHLPPGKYGVQIVPPPGPDGKPKWVQTSTIEGSKTIDAWVKANEPEVFVEFGPPGPHVFVGFVQLFDCFNDPANENCTGFNALPDGSGATISGSIVNNHMSRSPQFGFFNGEPFEGCRIAVNQGMAGRTLYSQACDDPADFRVTDVPPGEYSLSIWDNGLNVVIANHPFIVQEPTPGNFTISGLINPAQLATAGQNAANFQACGDASLAGCDLGQIPVFDWFFNLSTSVFYDRNENGYRDCASPACDGPNDDVNMNADSTATNIRWRDGRIYNSVPVDVFGDAPHQEVFPFFHWLVAEVDFATFKATGATFIVDAGGNDADLQDNGYVAQDPNLPICQTVSANNPDDPDDVIVTNQPCTFDGVSRTETGPVLTQGFQGFLGQKSVMMFGKADYEHNENGGISGMAVYAITRAEDDPRFAVAEQWEPGIPRVQVALFNDGDLGSMTLPDVDNYPLGWADGGAMGPEDVDRNGNGSFDQGDAIEVTWTDSWDDNVPTQCGGTNQLYATPGDPNTALVQDDKCFDGLRNFNQARPAVFDGGYAFSENLTPGYYIVKSFTPPGYKPLAEEDKNVDFGEEYAVPQLLPPVCAGLPHTVPQYLSYVSDTTGALLPGYTANPDIEAPFANQTRAACDAKRVVVNAGKNAAADFHYLTMVPKAAHVVGGVINDLANEFNPAAPTFGEKFSPPWVPVAFYDYAGNEVNRVYTDQYGKYNAMLPSTFTVNAASPSGMSPNMLTACMNDAGNIPDPSNPGSFIPDPNHNPQYSQFCYTFQFMPGGTTYLDTPVQQIAAFAGPGKLLDCEAADATPMIHSVTGPFHQGPYVPDAGNIDPATGSATVAEADRMLTITSRGNNVLVPNPAYDNNLDRLLQPQVEPKFIARNFGFGDAPGVITLIPERGVNQNQAETWPVTAAEWSDLEINTPIPAGMDNGRYQMVITSAGADGISGTADDVSSEMAITVTVGPLRNRRAQVIEVVPSADETATPIQDALLAARRGDLVLVTPGTYNEIPIMNKPVYLQGAGAFSTIINARSVPTEKVTAWRDLIRGPQMMGTYSLLAAQEPAEVFRTEEGAGLTVVGLAGGRDHFSTSRQRRSGIDGFTIKGASTGGGVFLNGYINGFRVTNNLITSNQGTYGGGVRVGHYNLITTNNNGDSVMDDGHNDNVEIRYNMITQNGAMFGVGGGIAMYNGSDRYRISDNLICGNYAATDGAGIGHLGLSPGGRIEDNRILFNQSFRQTPGFETDGGGILISGYEALPGTGLSEGAGNDIRIDRNLIQGNQAGAGDGGGIALRRINGQDLTVEHDFGHKPERWNRVRVRNNTIVNNVAGLAGGAVALKDAARVDMYNNTIANNMSTATAGAAFAQPDQSTPQVAGVVSRVHSAELDAVIDYSNSDLSARYATGFSNPLFYNNIVWENRASFYTLADNALNDAGVADLGVAGNPTLLFTYTRNNLMTDKTGYDQAWRANLDATDGLPGFVQEYLNQSPFLGPSPQEFKTVQVAPALDEGGNWLDVRYSPLSINDIDGDSSNALTPSDYHLLPTSIAVDSGRSHRGGSPNRDIDGDAISGTVDIGSDEVL